MDLAALEARVTRIEDLEAIKQLKARYCEVCDDDHNPDDILTIFAEDGIWEGYGIGTANGHAEIRELFQRFQSAMSFTQHMVMNPIIEIDGNTAKGRWYFFGPFTMKKGGRKAAKDIKGEAVWQAARYHEVYSKIGGEWKIQHLKIARPTMYAEYAKGWAK